MEKLKTVDIKSLSRDQLEAAYLQLLKVSEMKTGLIRFLEKSGQKQSIEPEEPRPRVKCPSCDFIVPGSMDICPACRFDFGFENYRCRACGNLIDVDQNLCQYCLNPNVLHCQEDNQ